MTIYVISVRKTHEIRDRMRYLSKALGIESRAMFRGGNVVDTAGENRFYSGVRFPISNITRKYITITDADGHDIRVRIQEGQTIDIELYGAVDKIDLQFVVMSANEVFQ